MAIEVLTKEDLQQFKNELLSEMAQLVHAHSPIQQKWLKSKEVLEMLNISPGTLQNLRINGTLAFTKIGGTIYYARDTITTLLEQNKRSS
ncbi:Helix-turn-helix domain-containing protein [Flavobacterium succinicans]|uniref:Helix-turn-helix domain-containing protein n=1 Tax=Flavobacterium succinicans TaxID=29536 RepID=A0A1I4TNV5_9FLAO|nr:helix-turn-helix domain-containing protein [Flavobacterium succinicans]SFM78311.1 Helix-turn-helix domain-containing protein [Flavobacterium succinicans]